MVILHDGTEVKFQCRDIVALAIDLFFDPAFEGTVPGRHEPCTTKGQRVYGEVFSGERVRHLSEEIPACGTLLGIIGYTDGTNLSDNGRQTALPLYVSLANHPESFRKKAAGRRLVVYIPQLSGDGEAQRRKQLELYHKVLRVALAPLRSLQMK